MAAQPPSRPARGARRRTAAPPGDRRAWTADVESVLIPARRIQRRVREMGEAITHAYAGRDLVLVPLLSGTVLFLADLVRHIDIPLRIDFMGTASYGAGRTPGRLRITKKLQTDVRGCDVLIVDDILDTGRTLSRVRDHLAALAPRTLKICVLLDKPGGRQVPIAADYVGFTIPNAFVVGYGLDYAERFRNLPYVGVLRPPA